jgi:two-component system response regulator FixJ
MAGTGDNGAGQAAPAERPLVAIVDDDASVRKSTRRLILALGYRAEAFASGAEFFASVAAATASCLLLDVRMPDMDGLEVQRRVAAGGRALPIIFVSGHASDEEERRARAAGAVEFFRKPLDTATLLHALRKVLPDTGG